MAVTTWTAGEVLTAADLNDTFASKPAATYGTAEPTSPATGDIWYDSNESPAAAKYYDGSAWQVFSTGGFATVSATTGSPSTGTYNDGTHDWTYYKFTGSGSITVTEGLVDLLVVGAGGGGRFNSFLWAGGGGGEVRWGIFEVTAGTITVTVPGTTAAGTNNGGTASFGSYLKALGGQGAVAFGAIAGQGDVGVDGYSSSGGRAIRDASSTRYGGGAGGTAYGANARAGITLDYDAGSSIEYGAARGDASAGTNGRGEGAGAAQVTGGSGVVIVRVR